MTARSFSHGLAACSLAVLTLAGAASALPSVAARAHRPLAHAMLGLRVRGAQVRRMTAGSGSSLIGSMLTTTATPPVPRPPTQPCIVPLFTNYQFAQYAAQGFSYAPPAGCKPPWAKVVFEGNFAITPGVQYDRTLDIWIGNTNVLFGTTPEPLSSVSDTWHVERDVTDLTPLLKTAQPGEVELFNIIETGLNGVQSGTTDLAFYPASRIAPAPETPDVVLPLSGGYGGELLSVTGEAAAAVSFPSLPKNIERAYLDVYSQSQGGDEFWYSCVSNDIAASGFSCGNTPFRETDVSIDGTLAGVAPVYPWIYTGGIDPFLWTPLPGVETLAFAAYRVDLTPFAALLSNGATHTISLGVYDANSSFSETGTLELYLDGRASHVTGGLVTNTLTFPNPVLQENVTDPGSAPNGSETISSSRSYRIAGYVNTSRGRIQTTIDGHIDFTNAQQIVDTDSEEAQDITQTTNASTVTTTAGLRGTSLTRTSESYPLIVDITLPFANDGSFSQNTAIDQRKVETFLSPTGGGGSTSEASSTDDLNFDSSGNFTGNSATQSVQTASALGTGIRCYRARIASAAGAITAVSGGC